MTEINVAAELKSPAKVFSHEISFEASKLTVMGRELCAVSPVTVLCNCMYDGDALLVEGHFDVSFAEQCARCGTDFTMPFACDFSERFEKVAAGDEPDDDDIYTFCGDVIDISKLIVDTVLLHYPMSVICGDDCDCVFEASEEQVHEQDKKTSLGDALFAALNDSEDNDDKE